MDEEQDNAIAEIRFGRPIVIQPGATLVVRLASGEDAAPVFDYDHLFPCFADASLDRVFLRLPCGGELFSVLYEDPRPRVDLEKPVRKELGGYFFCPLDCNEALDCPRCKKFIEEMVRTEPAVLASLWVEPSDGDESDRDEPDVAHFDPEVPADTRAGHFARCAWPSSHFYPRSLFAKVLDRIVNGKRKAAKRCDRKKDVDDGLGFHAAESTTGTDKLSPDPATKGTE